MPYIHVECVTADLRYVVYAVPAKVFRKVAAMFGPGLWQHWYTDNLQDILNLPGAIRVL